MFSREKTNKKKLVSCLVTALMINSTFLPMTTNLAYAEVVSSASDESWAYTSAHPYYSSVSLDDTSTIEYSDGTEGSITDGSYSLTDTDIINNYSSLSDSSKKKLCKNWAKYVYTNDYTQALGSGWSSYASSCQAATTTSEIQAIISQGKSIMEDLSDTDTNTSSSSNSIETLANQFVSNYSALSDENKQSFCKNWASYVYSSYRNGTSADQETYANQCASASSSDDAKTILNAGKNGAVLSGSLVSSVSDIQADEDLQSNLSKWTSLTDSEKKALIEQRIKAVDTEGILDADTISSIETDILTNATSAIDQSTLDAYLKKYISATNQVNSSSTDSTTTTSCPTGYEQDVNYDKCCPTGTTYSATKGMCLVSEGSSDSTDSSSDSGSGNTWLAALPIVLGGGIGGTSKGSTGGGDSSSPTIDNKNTGNNGGNTSTTATFGKNGTIKSSKIKLAQNKAYKLKPSAEYTGISKYGVVTDEESEYVKITIPESSLTVQGKNGTKTTRNVSNATIQLFPIDGTVAPNKKSVIKLKVTDKNKQGTNTVLYFDLKAVDTQAGTYRAVLYLDGEEVSLQEIEIKASVEKLGDGTSDAELTDVDVKEAYQSAGTKIVLNGDEPKYANGKCTATTTDGVTIEVPTTDATSCTKGLFEGKYYENKKGGKTVSFDSADELNRESSGLENQPMKITTEDGEKKSILGGDFTAFTIKDGDNKNSYLLDTMTGKVYDINGKLVTTDFTDKYESKLNSDTGEYDIINKSTNTTISQTSVTSAIENDNTYKKQTTQQVTNSTGVSETKTSGGSNSSGSSGNGTEVKNNNTSSSSKTKYDYLNDVYAKSKDGQVNFLRGTGTVFDGTITGYVSKETGKLTSAIGTAEVEYNAIVVAENQKNADNASSTKTRETKTYNGIRKVGDDIVEYGKVAVKILDTCGNVAYVLNFAKGRDRG